MDYRELFHGFVAFHDICLAAGLRFMRGHSAMESLPLLFGYLCFFMSCVLWRDMVCTVTVLGLVVGLKMSPNTARGCVKSVEAKFGNDQISVESNYDKSRR